VLLTWIQLEDPIALEILASNSDIP